MTRIFKIDEMYQHNDMGSENGTVILTNDVSVQFPNKEEAYEDYVEECELNEVESYEMDSTEFLQWLYERTNLYLEDDLREIKRIKNNSKYAITGTIGRWNGPANIEVVVMDSLYDALMKIFQASFDNHTTAYLENDGYIHVTQSHHDGTNEFRIYELSGKGLEAYDAYCNNEIDEFNLTDDEIDNDFVVKIRNIF